jgi:hypothetical protein
MTMRGLSSALAALLVGTAALEVVRMLVASLWLGGVLPESVAVLGYGALVALVTLATLAMFPVLAWFTFRAAKNLAAWEPDFSESPAGSAVSWFVPGWNLYKPYDALCTIWSATANHLPGDEPRGPTRLVEVFWAAWVLSIVVGRVLGGGSGDAWVGVGDVVAASLSAAACVAGALVVRRIAGLQDEAARVVA